MRRLDDWTGIVERQLFGEFKPHRPEHFSD
jgi:hypothetical protein